MNTNRQKTEYYPRFDLAMILTYVGSNSCIGFHI